MHGRMFNSIPSHYLLNAHKHHQSQHSKLSADIYNQSLGGQKCPKLITSDLSISKGPGFMARKFLASFGLFYSFLLEGRRFKGFPW